MYLMIETHILAARRMARSCLCFRSRRLARVLTRAYDDALRPLGIQATQLTLMNAIALGGESGTRTAVIVDALAIDGTTLSRNLRTLERAGLVAVRRAPDDRRVRIVSLTRSGQQTVSAALPVWHEVQERISVTLDAESAEEFGARLDFAVRANSPATLEA